MKVWIDCGSTLHSLDQHAYFYFNSASYKVRNVGPIILIQGKSVYVLTVY